MIIALPAWPSLGQGRCDCDKLDNVPTGARVIARTAGWCEGRRAA